MKINQFSEGIELGDHTADEPGWFIVRQDGKIASGPYDSERAARSDTPRLHWFTPSQYFIDYGIQDNDDMFVDAETGQLGEDADQIPVRGDIIRTPKLEGKVSKVEEGYVYFTTADGRNMRNTIQNCTVIEKLADQETEMFEDEEIDEVSTELLAKYKTAAGKDASAADKKGDYARGNKRFSGIVKATKKQFVNDTKPKTEGTMGGINRSRPAQDVSYEKVLDRNPETAHSKVVGEDAILNDVMEKWQQVNELSNNKMMAYTDAAKSEKSFRTRPLRKLAKSAKGVAIANQKINTRTGNVKDPDAGKGTYESRLAEFVELNEVDKDEFANQFGDLLGKQEQEKKAAAQKVKPAYIPIDKRWTVRYRPQTKEFEKVQWQVLDGHKENSIAHEGTAMSNKDAVSMAQEWVGNRGAALTSVTKNSTLDFNVRFLEQISQGNTFYAAIDEYDGEPALIFSFEPNEDLKLMKSTPRSTKTDLPGVPVSGAMANKADLKAHGRYELGPRIEYAPGIYIFPLKYDSSAESKTDRKRLQVPSFTVGTSDRGVDEDITPWGGYTADDPKANALNRAPKTSMKGAGDVRFSDMVKDTIEKHGVKWAFDFYVKKHGLPPRQFQIFAGLTTAPKAVPKVKGDWTDPSRSNRPRKQSWWQKLKSKLPFEE